MRTSRRVSEIPLRGKLSVTSLSLWKGEQRPGPARGLVRAVRLWSFAQEQREMRGCPLPPADRTHHEQALAAVRHQLRKQIFTAAWTGGRSMTTEQAVEALCQAPLFLTEATDGIAKALSRASTPFPSGPHSPRSGSVGPGGPGTYRLASSQSARHQPPYGQ